MQLMFLRPVIVAAMAATFCLATFAPLGANKAAAQGVSNAYKAYINQSKWSYNAHRAYGSSAYGSSAYGSSAYGSSAYGYTGYGSGPYGYTSSPLSVYPPYGNYNYRSDINYGRYYRGMYFDGGTYRPIYNPNTTRYYNPYYGYVY